MAAASTRLERYAFAATLPVCVAGAASGDIVHTQVDQTLNWGDTWSATVLDMGINIAFTGSYDTDRFSDGYGGGGFTSFSNSVLAWMSNTSWSGLNGFAMKGSSSELQHRFDAGETIGGGSGFNWYGSGNLMRTEYQGKIEQSTSTGDWANAGESVQGYLGFRLQSGDGSDFNYGWIDITFTGSELIVGAYAYESDLNTAIVAGATESAPVVPGAPTAVGLIGLAAGAAGIRRKRSA